MNPLTTAITQRSIMPITDVFGTSNACILSTKLAYKFKVFRPSYSRATLMQKTCTLITFQPGLKPLIHFSFLLVLEEDII